MRPLLISSLLVSFAFAAMAEDAAGPETLFERSPTDAEKKQFILKELLHFSKDDYATLREKFKDRKWGSEVVKVQLRRVGKKDSDPEMAKLPGYGGQKENTPFIMITYLGERFFTGKIDEATQQQFAVRLKHLEVERLATMDQIRSEFTQKKWGPKIVRVELLYRGMMDTPPYVVPYVEVTYLGEEKKALEELQATRGRQQKEFAIGKDALNCKYRGCGFNPLMQENFEHSDKRKVEIAHVECDDAQHELLRFVIESDSDIVGMKFGPAIFSAVPATTGDGKASMKTRVSWLSGTNHVITVSSVRMEDSDPCREFAELLGEKFPSALKADFKIDKTQWGREEVELRLKQMDEALKGSSGDFLESYAALSKAVWLPAWLAYTFDYDLNFQQRALKGLNEWWAADKDKYIWSGTLQRLTRR